MPWPRPSIAPGSGLGGFQGEGARYTLSLTEAGRTEMLKRLRKPADHEITENTRFLTILAFLSHLPDVADPYRRGMMLTARATSRPSTPGCTLLDPR